MGIIFHKHEMQQIVIKEKIYQIRIINRTRADGDGYQNHATMYNKQRTGKIIIQVTIYLNHTSMNFSYIKKIRTRGSPQHGADDGMVRAIDGGYDGDLEGTK